MQQYLSRYAEPEWAAAEAFPEGTHWSNVLVVPVCNETSSFLESRPDSTGRLLWIIVINQPVGASISTFSANQDLASTISDGLTISEGDFPAGIQWFRDLDSPRDILLIDRYQPGRELPPDGGVGMARKIGADLATALYSRGMLESRWIHCSDGDVELPSTYFSCLEGQGKAESLPAACVYPFEHVECSDEANSVLQATRLYEFSLYYYVAGLSLAGSPYAFQTIGSTMAIDAESYAKVRGFPRRPAGEDFYLLNKLAKVGPIHSLRASSGCAPLRIRARRSDRVPFGTGAAVNTIAEMESPISDYLYYHPHIFELLEFWYQSWESFWRLGTDDLAIVWRDFAQGSGTLPEGFEALCEALADVGAAKTLQHALRQSRSWSRFRAHMNTGFDAFRTLKLVHRLRDMNYPSLPLGQLAPEPAFSRMRTRNADLDERFRNLSGSAQV